MLRHMLALAACLVSAIFSVPALAQPALVQQGRLTYGTAATFAPFEYQQGGSFVGFDIELGAAIAAKMKLQPSTLNMDFSGLIPALQGGRVDIINSGMYINPQRSTQVDFVPYMRIGNEIVVRKGNPQHITTRGDLCGHTVAVTLGGIEETYAHQDVDTCQKAGKKALTIMTLPTAQDEALAVRQGRADALYNSTPGAAKLVSELGDQFEVAGEPFENSTQIGIAVRKGDTAMRDALTAALHAVVQDGTYARLLQKYNLPASGSIF